MDQDDGSVLALLQDIIIHPDTGRIEGFWVKPLTVPLANGVIHSDSILEWKKNIYIKGDNEISEADEIIKIAEILERKCLFMGAMIKNEEGEVLGRVEDLDFDTKKLRLNNLYTQKNFIGFRFNKRAFSYKSVVEVLPEHIVVKDVEEKKIEEGIALPKDQPLMDI